MTLDPNATVAVILRQDQNLLATVGDHSLLLDRQVAWELVRQITMALAKSGGIPAATAAADTANTAGADHA